MNTLLLVVFDGLRPDMIRPDITPNLVRFAARGTRFSRARSVFPSETRVCTASVVTGCLPRRHGLVANRLAHPGDRRRSVDTSQMNALKALPWFAESVKDIRGFRVEQWSDFTPFMKGSNR